MSRFSLRGAATASLLGSLLACVSNAPVSVTKSADLVSQCESVGPVSVEKSTREDDVTAALADAARQKGGNYVLIAEDGARSGVAYRCSAPGGVGGGGR